MNSFNAFFRFEIIYWLRSAMVWVLLAIMTSFLMLLLFIDDSNFEALFFGDAYRNSPFVIMRLYSITAVFGGLMVTAFVNTAACRDFTSNTQQLIFTKPIGKASYLFGRFLAAFLIGLIPSLGASIAVLLVPMFSSQPVWGPIHMGSHFWSLLVIAIPNTFFYAAVVFAIAVWTRSALASYLGILGFLIAITIGSGLATTMDNRMISSIVDPTGDTAISTITEYWTTAERNTRIVPLSPALLWNRVIWLVGGMLFFAIGYFRFGFNLNEGLISRLFRQSREAIVSNLSQQFHTAEPPQVRRNFGLSSQVLQMISLIKQELWQIARNPIFICILIGVVFVSFSQFSFAHTAGFDLKTRPVTFNIVEQIIAATSQFSIVLITLFAGLLVWKNRDLRFDEIVDALPVPNGVHYLSKLISLTLIIYVVVLVGMGCGILYQAVSGHFDFQLANYSRELLWLVMVQWFSMISLALLCHVLSPNKYVGYFSYIGVLVAAFVILPALDVRSFLFRFGQLPGHVRSDMLGLEPYQTSLFWGTIYWLIVAASIGLFTITIWPRGKENQLLRRASRIPTNLRGPAMIASILLFCAWGGTTAWIVWNTRMVNEFSTSDDEETFQATYERDYRSFIDRPHPRLVKITQDIAIFPHERRLEIKGVQTLKNQTDEPISEILVSANPSYESNVSGPGLTVSSQNEELGTMLVAFDKPLQPGESKELNFGVSYAAEGFEEKLAVPEIMPNGTFFNSLVIPQVGYVPLMELRDARKREKNHLTGEAFTPLDADNLTARANSYISHNSDWIELETVISTSEDQIAVAPGSLIETWNENGRRYFRYRLDHPSLNFSSYVSARFRVASRQLDDIEIEVYHHPDHEWNVDRMLQSIRKSLEYYTREFGPYRHKQARIIEFPRIQTFAQAFPGTMPYSEGVGFVAEISKADDIDMVFYVVAHEMAHQWWAHQVISADMRAPRFCRKRWHSTQR
ncbi:MAG: ABC transporter permease subunit [Pirellulaceae bacterium]